MFTALICSLIAMACVTGNAHGPSSDDRSRPQNVAENADTIIVASDAYLGPDGDDYWKGTTDSLVVDGVRSTRILIQADQAAIAAAIGSGTLAKATLELTVQNTGAAWPVGGSTVDAHRVLQHWTEAEVTWVCADGHEAWDMGTGAGSIWQTAHTARTTITNGQTGVVQFDVTADVAAFMSNPQSNHGWLIRRTSEGASEPGRISFASREGAPQPRLIIQVNAGVPESAPDSVPAWVMADSNIVDGSPLISGSFVGQIVIVIFKRGASLAERTSAIESVGGTVVGGRAISGAEGSYLVRVSDPGDGSGLLQAATQLRALPQISVATIDVIAAVQWLAPTDGTGFDWWQPGATNVTSSNHNWSLQMVHAPEAWGCEVGSPNAPVAAVDGNLQNRADLSGNVVLAQGTTFQAPGDGHATNVLSVLASLGNNGVGMTGLMWRAGVRYYDFAQDSIGQRVIAPSLDELRVPMERAARNGAKAVNVSAGIRWSGQFTGGARDSTRVGAYLLQVQGLLARLRADGIEPPLYVLAAGNDGLDAYFNGFTAIRAGPDSSHFLVVGGVNDQAQRFQGSGATGQSSNQGPLLDVLAPAEDVAVLASNGAIVRASGTSFAAPLATGIAGLLLSFDPTLTPTQLKALIVEGANNGALVGTGFTHARPVVNAYNSLKLAARRPGTPLCGNRIWVENGVNVRVERAAGDETIATLASPVTSIITYHGGRIIRHSGAYLRYAGGTWTSEPGLPPSEATVSGSFHSAMSWTHDRDSIVNPQWAQAVTSSGPLPISMLSYPTFVGRLVSNVPVVLGMNEKAYVSTSPSPVAGTILVSVSIVGTDTPPEYSKRAIIYRLPWLGGSPTQVVEIPDRTVAWLGFAEDGSEFAVATGRKVSVPGAPIENCELSFRSIATGNATRTVPVTGACNDESNIAGGFAPLRAGGSRARH